MISSFRPRMKRLWKLVLRTIWPGSRRRSSATRPSKCTPRRKSSSENWNVPCTRHWCGNVALWLIFVVPAQGQWGDRWGAGQEQGGDVRPAGAAATGAVEGAVAGEKPGSEGGQELMQHSRCRSKRVGHANNSAVFLSGKRGRRTHETLRWTDQQSPKGLSSFCKYCTF